MRFTAASLLETSLAGASGYGGHTSFRCAAYWLLHPILAVHESNQAGNSHLQFTTVFLFERLRFHFAQYGSTNR